MCGCVQDYSQSYQQDNFSKRTKYDNECIAGISEYSIPSLHCDDKLRVTNSLKKLNCKEYQVAREIRPTSMIKLIFFLLEKLTTERTAVMINKAIRLNNVYICFALT